MASEQSHRDQAEYNEKAARSVTTTYPDWAVTMCFYAALHWVERYAKNKGCELEREYSGRSLHESRAQYIYDLASQLGNQHLRKAYSALERESKKARYLHNIDSDARSYYSNHSKQGVTQSLQNLQIVKQLLS